MGVPWVDSAIKEYSAGRKGFMPQSAMAAALQPKENIARKRNFITANLLGGIPALTNSIFKRCNSVVKAIYELTERINQRFLLRMQQNDTTFKAPVKKVRLQEGQELKVGLEEVTADGEMTTEEWGLGLGLERISMTLSAKLFFYFFFASMVV